MSEDGSYWALVPDLTPISLGDGTVFTTMFIAAGDRGRGRLAGSRRPSFGEVRHDGRRVAIQGVQGGGRILDRLNDKPKGDGNGQ
jgi:hypothetical protein